MLWNNSFTITLLHRVVGDMSAEKCSHPGPPPLISNIDVLVNLKGLDAESGRMFVSKELLDIDM